MSGKLVIYATEVTLLTVTSSSMDEAATKEELRPVKKQLVNIYLLYLVILTFRVILYRNN